MATIYSNKISVAVQGKTVQFLASLSPTSSTITLGSSVVLTCTVSGGVAPYIYNWYVDGVNVGGYGSTYTYTPSTSGTHTVYVYVVDSQNNSTTSNSSTIIVNQPSVSYTVSVSASQTTNLTTNQQVTFTVNVTASDGSSVDGTATLYLTNASGAIWGTFPITLTNGSGSTTIIPGLYLAQGYDTEYYYAIYNGFKSQVYQLTFITSVPPTYLQLSSSGTPSYMTFTITADSGSNFTAYLYVYNSYANASNAPPNGQWSTGQWGQWQVPVTNGKGSTDLVPSAINTNTQYWVAVYQTPSGTILRSNILTVQG